MKGKIIFKNINFNFYAIYIPLLISSYLYFYTIYFPLLILSYTDL